MNLFVVLILGYVALSEFLALLKLITYARLCCNDTKYAKTHNSKYQNPLLAKQFVVKEIVLYASCLWALVLVFLFIRELF